MAFMGFKVYMNGTCLVVSHTWPRIPVLRRARAHGTYQPAIGLGSSSAHSRLAPDAFGRLEIGQDAVNALFAAWGFPMARKPLLHPAALQNRTNEDAAACGRRRGLIRLAPRQNRAVACQVAWN